MRAATGFAAVRKCGARLLLAGQSEGAHPSTGTSGVRYRRKNGEAFPSETIHTGFYDRAGARLGWMVLIHDATAERQQEAVLLQVCQCKPIPWPGWRGVRTAQWLFARTSTQGWILFDVLADPLGLDNLTGRGNPMQKEMQALLAERMAAVGDSWA